MTSVIDGHQTNLELCDACFQQHMLFTKLRIPDMSTARCDYCGGSPTGASLKRSWERGTSDGEFTFTCLACSLVKVEEIERLADELRAVGEPPSTIEATTQFMNEVERRVRIRVSGGEGAGGTP